MSTTYNVVAGDTFESIARKQYGSEQNAALIVNANPGATEPLTAGTFLTIPPQPGVPTDKPQELEEANENEVAILIDGERFRFWTESRVTRALDMLDTLELSAPMDVNLANFRETFQPFTYKPIEVTVGGLPLFKGTILGINPTVEADEKTVSVSAYSLPGVLNDCTAPASAFPLEFDFVGLRDIATTLAALFGLTVVFDVDQGAVFERESLAPGAKVWPFLVGLAQQRGLVIASTPKGELLFTRSADASRPVAKLAQGSSPVESVIPTFSPQEFYSHVTGIEPVIIGLAGSQITVKNASLAGVLRPFTFEAPDTIEGPLNDAVEAKAGRMWGNMASYNVRVDTWRDSAGELWLPNTTVSLHAPDAFVYEPYDFIIRSVDFNRDDKTESATLNLVIPGAFNGEQPEALPWAL